MLTEKFNGLINKYLNACIYFVKPSVQIVLMLVTIVIFYAISFWPVRNFVTNDPSPSLTEVVTSTGKPVKTGLYIRNFMNFDILQNTFVVDAILWFEADRSVSISTLSKFILGKGEITKQSEPIIEELPNNKQLIRYDVRLTFPSNLNHQLFPFGDHTLFINLSNRSANVDDIYFVSSLDSFVVAESIYTVGWRLHKTNVKSGQTIIELDKTNSSKKIYAPRTVFKIDFKDISSRELWLIVFPLLIFFFVAMFSFSVDPEKYYALKSSMATTSLSAALSYRYVIQNLAPKVEYAMFSDYIFFLFLIGIFLAVITNLLIQPKEYKITGLVVLGFYFLINFSWAALIFWFF